MLLFLSSLLFLINLMYYLGVLYCSAIHAGKRTERSEILPKIFKKARLWILAWEPFKISTRAKSTELGYLINCLMNLLISINVNFYSILHSISSSSSLSGILIGIIWRLNRHVCFKAFMSRVRLLIALQSLQLKCDAFPAQRALIRWLKRIEQLKWKQLKPTKVNLSEVRII